MAKQGVILKLEHFVNYPSLKSNDGIKNAAQWLECINVAMFMFNIDTPQRLAGFLGQMLYESHNFTKLEESFIYTPERLLQVFPNKFDNLQEAIDMLATGSKNLANYLYNGKLGNVVESNDGWNFRGRGICQLTGRDNYEKAAAFFKGKNEEMAQVATNPEILLKPLNATLIAGWFWQEHKLNTFADKNDWDGITKVINGGYNGHLVRLSIITYFLTCFSVSNMKKFNNSTNKL